MTIRLLKLPRFRGPEHLCSEVLANVEEVPIHLSSQIVDLLGGS